MTICLFRRLRDTIKRIFGTWQYVKSELLRHLKGLIKIKFQKNAVGGGGHFWTRDTKEQYIFHVKHIIEKFQKIIKYMF
jgi:hypothetical protein